MHVSISTDGSRVENENQAHLNWSALDALNRTWGKQDETGPNSLQRERSHAPA